MKNKNKGFTILEILIVIAIIAILSAVIIPVSYYSLNKAKEDSKNLTVQTMAVDVSRILTDYNRQNSESYNPQNDKNEVFERGGQLEKRRVFVLNQLIKLYGSSPKILVTSDPLQENVSQEAPEILTDNILKRIYTNTSESYIHVNAFEHKNDYQQETIVVFINDDVSNFIVAKYVNFNRESYQTPQPFSSEN